MPTSSLNRMTVPIAFGTDNSNPTQGLLMPKLSYRFRVTFLGFGVSTPTTELTKQVIDCGRPKLSFDPIILDVYNSRIKLAGKYTWDKLAITIRDDAAGQVSQLVGEQIQKQFDFMEQSSASSGIDYKFQTDIQVLDGGNGNNEPVVLETWSLYGCYIENCNWNEMDYSQSKDMRISLSLNFDNALQNPPGTGVGAPVIRTLGDIAV